MMLKNEVPWMLNELYDPDALPVDADQAEGEEQLPEDEELQQNYWDHMIFPL